MSTAVKAKRGLYIKRDAEGRVSTFTTLDKDGNVIQSDSDNDAQNDSDMSDSENERKILTDKLLKNQPHAYFITDKDDILDKLSSILEETFINDNQEYSFVL